MTQLILVEGLPGSGKTSTARFIAKWLKVRGADCALYLEGNWDHPADFESVACLDAAEYQQIITQFPEQVEFLNQRVTVRGDNYFFSYRQIEHEYEKQVPPALIKALAHYEIYELPIDKFRRLLLERWQGFAERTARENQIYIFECCFLQNPLTMYLGRCAEPIPHARDFILEIAECIRNLDPCLVYLNPRDVETTLLGVAKTRPSEWLDFVIAYHTQQGYGEVHGWQGFEGLVKFYEMRRRVELELLTLLPFPVLAVQHTDWVKNYALIDEFLGKQI